MILFSNCKKFDKINVEYFMNSRRLIIVCFVIVAGVFLFFQFYFFEKKSLSDNRLNVVASFYPIAEFARQVGGEYINVETITPSGIEPHDYEPNAQQIKSVYQADVFLYNGGGIDAWASRIAPDVSLRGVLVTEMSRSIDLVESVEDNETYDPHFWLDPVLAQQEILIIKNILVQIDSKHSEIYQKNADDYIVKLKDLDYAYRIGLANCQYNTVVTSHDVFAYLAREYGSNNGRVIMNFVSIAGLSPETEPTVGKFAEIIKLIREKNIKYIFFETMTSPKLSQTIADEVGVKTLIFNPLEGLTSEEMIGKENYVTIMEENLRNLKIGMLCQ